jgi:CubicO group peptidase (beta-lactamase class C family)
MLVEEGRVLLNDPIAKYMPEFSDLKVAVPADGKLNLEPANRAITVQDLLRHTSGFSYDFISAGEFAKLYANAKLHDRGVDNAEFCRRLAQLPLLHQPGTHWAYGHSTDVVGRLVEVVHRRPLGDVLADTIFAPLGMHDTSFAVPSEKFDRLAQAFPNDPDTGKPLQTAVQLYDPRKAPVLHSGGGGLVGSAADYARFCQMLAGGGATGGVRLLGRKTLEFMASDHLSSTMVIDPSLGLLAPGYGFGLGFAVRRVTGEAPFPGSIGSYDWGGVAGTAFWIDPQEDLWALFMIQAPAQREYYRRLYRNLVYAALA